jgi:hypothetical protein
MNQSSEELIIMKGKSDKEQRNFLSRNKSLRADLQSKEKAHTSFEPHGI